MNNNMQFDKRKHERLNFPYTIECFDPNNDEEMIKGIAMNISVSGLCLYIPQYLDNGREITIKSFIYDSPQKATVCWTEKYDDDYYTVGCCLHNGCY